MAQKQSGTILTASKILVIGVDPGSRHTGWGAIEYQPQDRLYRYIDSGTIEPNTDDITDRLEYIFDTFVEILTKKTSLNQQIIIGQEKFFARGGMRGGDLVGKTCGVLQLAGKKAKVDFFTEINKATVNTIILGKGRKKKGKTSKLEIRSIIERKLNIKKELSLDESDALAVALTIILTDLSMQQERLMQIIKTQE